MTDLAKLQSIALDFLQEQLTNPDLSEQQKIEIALGIINVQPSQSQSLNVSSSTSETSEIIPSQTLPIPELYSLSESWQTWLVENKLRGVSDKSLVDILVGQNITEEVANQVVFALPQEVSFAYLQPQWRSLQQQKLAAELYREKENTIAGKIHHRSNLSEADFRDNYHQVNRPVLLTELGGDRPWHTKDSFAQTFGDHQINALAFPELSSKKRVIDAIDKNPTTIGQYFALAEPQVYVNFDLHELGDGAIAACYDAYPQLKTYLDSQNITTNQAFLWLQSTFSAFPLQAKAEDLFVLQLWGESQWHLASSWQSEFLYGDENWTSPLDLADYNEQQYPLCSEAKFHQLTLTAGQALFIPALWWQQCRALEHTAQICFSNLKSK